jgi:TfoX/Sxy family transcriptional regulator of competence genes
VSHEFDAVRTAFAGVPDIGEKKMFGAAGISTGGKFFAMEYKGALVVKLPAERDDALIAGGIASRFDPGHGRPMKEWASFAPGSADWVAMAREAYDFVKG